MNVIKIMAFFCVSTYSYLNSADYESKAQVENRTINLWNSLKEAINESNLEAFNFLINKNSKFLNHQDNDGMTLLMHACIAGQDHIVESICSLCKDSIDLENKSNETALVICTKKGFVSIIKILLKFKAKAIDSSGKLFYEYADSQIKKMELRDILNKKVMEQDSSWCSIQ